MRGSPPLQTNSPHCAVKQQTDTIAAIATPPGQGGIGIVKVSGTGCLEIAGQLCKTTPSHRQCLPAVFCDESGGVIDRGLVVFFQEPDSHTGEDTVEFHGHGGPVVMGLLLNRVLSLGARHAHPGEFSERAFLNNKIDLLQAEAVADLISSASEQAAMSAARSLEGGFSSVINALSDRLIELRVFVEATLDFPEEEPGLSIEQELQQRTNECICALQEIIFSAEDGRVLIDGLELAIIGKPNVGKSSLLNCLAKKERAIVSPEPGTTRDTLEQDILIEGIPVKIIDTAGIRPVDDSIEQEGIKRAKRAAEKADVVVLIGDVNSDELQELIGMARELDLEKNLVFVFNKTDLLTVSPRRCRDDGGPKEIFISAKTGEGVELLKRTIKQMVTHKDYSENTFIARARHINALKRAGSLLERGIDGFSRHQAIELFAEDLLRAQQSLDVITGKFAADDLLGEIFSRFCIGK